MIPKCSSSKPVVVGESEFGMDFTRTGVNLQGPQAFSACIVPGFGGFYRDVGVQGFKDSGCFISEEAQ